MINNLFGLLGRALATGRLSHARYAAVVLVVAAAAALAARRDAQWWEIAAITSFGMPATFRRLRTLALPAWPAALVALPPIAPVIAALLLVGGRRASVSDAASARARHSIRAAAIAIAATAVLGVILAFLSANVAHSYGWTLFVTLPYVLGLIATLSFSASATRSLSDATAVTAVTVATVGVALVLLSLEGAICVLMAAPLAFAVALVGAFTAHALIHLRTARSPRMLCSVVLVVPALLAGESTDTRAPPLVNVSTTVVVDAPLAVVWRHVIAFRALPQPHERIFRLGIAYPIGASITGTGVGAVRRCRFSTGDFVEPVTVWDPPRHLAFSVASQPAPMTELSPYRAVHAPHLDGFLRSERGEFRLSPLPGGRTLLAGRTWYRNRMWPSAYWRLWSDRIIHSVHRRVLEHVRAEAEAEVAQSR